MLNQGRLGQAREAFDKVVKIARTLHDTKSLAKTFEGSVTQVLGTCLSVGCKVDGQSPKDITKKVKEGAPSRVEIDFSNVWLVFQKSSVSEANSEKLIFLCSL